MRRNRVGIAIDRRMGTFEIHPRSVNAENMAGVTAEYLTGRPWEGRERATALGIGTAAACRAAESGGVPQPPAETMLVCLHPVRAASLRAR